MLGRDMIEMVIVGEDSDEEERVVKGNAKRAE